MTAPNIANGDEPWAGDQVPLLSHSRINRYLTCPEQYRLHYVERLRPRVPSAGLAFGQLLHQALADLFQNGIDPVETFRTAWDGLAEIDLHYSRYESWERLQERGVSLLSLFVAEAVPRISNVVAVERPFELGVTSLPKRLVGFLDLVADLDGIKTVIDFKTTASAYGDHEALLSDQLSVYGLAEPEVFQAALCVLVRTKEPRIDWHLTSRSPKQLEAYLEKAGHVAHDIASGRYYKRPGLWCSWCDFLPVCLGDEQTARSTLIRLG